MLLDTGSDRQAESLANTALAEIHRLENIFSLFRPQSALSRLNRDGVLDAPPPELLEVLSLSRQLWQTSDSAFDPTVQPLWNAHMTGGDSEAALALVGFDGLEMSAQRLAFKKPGMGITLNGIAQGYITDRVAALLARGGLTHSLVQLGESRALGRKRDGRPWQVTMENPHMSDTGMMPIALDNEALAVSSGMGTVLESGVTHLFDPRSGKNPARYAEVAVKAPTAMLADGLSTALSMLEKDQARQLLSGHDGTSAWLVSHDGAVDHLGT